MAEKRVPQEDNIFEAAGGGPEPDEITVVAEPTHGTECHEAWRVGLPCPHDGEAALIDAFLADGEYEGISDWARDSGYTESDGQWRDENGAVVDLDECVWAAMDACGFLGMIEEIAG